ncbi:exonuclease SbcCD subunit D [Enterococcus rivorum]|uniref:Nuclease SbcCD subunit D n=1 Tax=Enterococcus rivorum TaxID=762845 RepID=A0A1E5KZV8_9ENTE|nr:exonuclease SbcCD subunit D [Enterococcus rivorum]MBP2099257.1 exonuclease SbcD [Enterococcus rivorum]OEH83363.1 exonuclease sbcCD subunit D [Enterococcus rivorum]
MRFLHTADWHIGKKLHGYDLLEEQRHAFQQILAIAKEEAVDGIVIAGDLYDRSVPAVEAVETFNDMMIQMNLIDKYPVFAISGNHDSSTRLETGGPWFSYLNFHLATRLEQAFQPVEFMDTQFFLLPYFEPIAARLHFEMDEIRTIDQAMSVVIEEMKKKFDPEKSHVLVSHFFVAGSEKTESETKLTVGGLDTVPLSYLEDFDYVALGHLHGKNALNGKNARYSGSPLKFSLSEMNQEKGVWIVDTDKNTTIFRFRELQPLRDIKQLQGSFSELTDQTFYENLNRNDYIHIQLTDRAVISNMMNRLRQVYPRIIGVERLYGRDNPINKNSVKPSLKKLAPLELVEQFFEEVTHEKLTSQQVKWVEDSLKSIHQEERGE